MEIVIQHDQMDCGPACLAMISSHYGKKISMQFLRDTMFITREGVSVYGLTLAANKIGFNNITAKLNVDDFNNELCPCILHWNQNHFVVLTKVSKQKFGKKLKYTIIDPGYGYMQLTKDEFASSWVTDDNKGIALFLEPTQEFYNSTFPQERKISLKYIFRYLKPYRKSMLWIILLLLVSSITTVVFPILTQKLVDDGVSKNDLNIVGVILLAQLAFFLGNMIADALRNWLTLVIGTKINIKIIADFLKGLFKLPMKFFEIKMMGDFNQRFQDHDRIENLLTTQSVITYFSFITFSVFLGILWYYDVRILLLYSLCTSLSVAWSLVWMKKRKILDYFRFQIRAKNQQSVYEIISGMPEIKLNQFENAKSDEWEAIQQELYKVNIRILKLDQTQTLGFEFINQLKNIIVTFLACLYVIKGNMTLGALLSVSYIIGQMNAPLAQFIGFFRSLQDAKLSFARLNEIEDHPIEESDRMIALDTKPSKVHRKSERGILLNNVSYQYEGPESSFVLDKINAFIPEGKVTAIVGASGSGKTTLMKLLLRFYDPTEGTIEYNKNNILDISPRDLRTNCGVVMQDGYIFTDSIERNITTGERDIEKRRLNRAVKIANIKSFIDELPLGYGTKIGAAGNGISGGQKQRVLIARAVYKNPHYIFFDEATSALDAENEKIIHDNLQSFFKGKTVVIIAHRLSTVKNADQIIVLKQGKIVEEGNHSDLVQRKGEYFNLVKNQLELGL
ncbi:peptidase domain-containing ABC transporter [Elizabethkingia anophelis]|uniref:ABC transporter ATP-binding protein n=2 Tax=Elizabethkingia anophelis TaxID=1117645 RepID=A0A455ZFF3_9FLAO|nr:peptidase domain-containing ABC transporter [Elizabethkingia anophelis]AIL46943.1 ABC transporter ATP-binding protein [Elizabethkingia anophelis NUHP1]DAC75394.1 TPA_exp: ABC transporter ATP-binding protein [Elizabethkingia anophelis]